MFDMLCMDSNFVKKNILDDLKKKGESEDTLDKKAEVGAVEN